MATATNARLSWCAEQRQIWIADMLAVYGFLNREHLQRKFSISQPQASHDLRTFLRTHPHAVTYDQSRKCYVAT